MIACDPSTHGAMLCPIILGSDKTTVSVATGQNEFYPLYMTIGNITNAVRRSHKGSVVLIGFLAIPKGKPMFQFVLVVLTQPQLSVNTTIPSASANFGASCCIHPSRSSCSTSAMLWRSRSSHDAAMIYFGGSSMPLQRTLPTTRNKSSSLLSFRVGVRSMYSCVFHEQSLTSI
jgi:hypothetical protein